METEDIKMLEILTRMKEKNESEELEKNCDAAFSQHYVILVNTDVIACKGFDEVYRLEDKLGEGAYGLVRKGKNLITGRDVAIKIQKERKNDSSELFKKEINNLRELIKDCKTFVCIEGWGMYKGKVFIAMEYVNGVSLRDYIRITDVNFRQRKFRMIADQLIIAVEKLHNKDMAHTDIKPDNVMIDVKTTKVKIVDFGLGCSKNTTCHLGGTKQYMPLRQMIGTLRDRQNGDWYSLALTLLELVDTENDFEYRRSFPFEYVNRLRLPTEIAQVVKDLLTTSRYVYDLALLGLGNDFA